MKPTIVVLSVAALLFGCAQPPPKDNGAKKEPAATETGKQPSQPAPRKTDGETESVKPGPTQAPVKTAESLETLFKKGQRLRDEFYRKRLLKAEFDKALLREAIETMSKAKTILRKMLSENPSDRRLMEMSSLLEPDLAALQEEKLRRDLLEKAEEQTRRLIKEGKDFGEPHNGK